jgi:hypothetical protein
MRGELVPDGDVAWERDDPRFRVFVYAGVDDSVRAVDLLDADSHDALESAKPLSNGDRDLWALALVVDDTVDGRGLVWLSGTDYRREPMTAAQRRGRREMQDRFLRERSRRGEPVVLPNGRRLIRMFPEWSVDLPLWESFSENYPATAAALGLADDLAAALREWNDEWQNRPEDVPLPDEEGWRERGIRLLERLREELDGVAEVRPEFLG